jgi:formate hydrogenlyase subunit 6/NADH:ubiquinone oxidoreductase subunit I
MAFFITESCTGCTACAKVCPTNAIQGERNARHVIDPNVCIDCGACGRICPAAAILDEQKMVCKMEKRSLWAKPVINAKLCTACSACIQACPVSVLALDLNHGQHFHFIPYLADEKNCIACSFCKTTCPVEAISMVTPKTA